MTSWATIFDCDGVLVNSEPLSMEAFLTALREYGILLDHHEREQSCGSTDREIIRFLRQQKGIQVEFEEFSRAHIALYKRLATEQGLELFPGVAELLAQLERARVPYALVSSGSREKISFNLKEVGLAGRFKVIVSGEELGISKPRPYVFLLAAQALGLEPARCVVIEDSLNGIRGGKAAGMRVVGVAHTFEPDRLWAAEADLVVTGLSELGLEQLQQLVLPEQRVK